MTQQQQAPAIPPDFYEAKLVDYGLGETKNHDPQAIAVFDFQQGEATHRLTWYGSFKEKAFKYTMEALHLLGFNANDPYAIAGGKTSDVLDLGKTVKIKVVHETLDKGTFVKVAGIYDRESTGGPKLLTPAEVKAKKYPDLRGKLMQFRNGQNGGAPAPAPSAAPAQQQPAAALVPPPDDKDAGPALGW